MSIDVTFVFQTISKEMDLKKKMTKKWKKKEERRKETVESE